MPYEKELIITIRVSITLYLIHPSQEASSRYTYDACGYEVIDFRNGLSIGRRPALERTYL